MYQEKGKPGVQYMAASYDENATHTTMIAGDGSTNHEVLHVPAGEWTLYLYDNGNGTVELSYEELPGKTLVDTGGDTPGSQPGQQEAVENTVVKTHARKAIIDGRLVIIRGEQMFDATGRAL